MSVFRFFESLLEPTALPPEAAAACWARGVLLALCAPGRQARRRAVRRRLRRGNAGHDDSSFHRTGVTLVSTHPPASLLREAAPQLLGMAAVVLLLRPAALLIQAVITNQAIAPGLTNLIRWQSHWHVVRQSWTFFQNDFAGRIANRVMQTGPSLRESVVAGTTRSGTSWSTAAAPSC